METKKKMNRPTKKIIQSGFIDDIENMSFEKNHSLWWTIDDRDNVIDFFKYEDFLNDAKKQVKRYLDADYIVMMTEEEFKIHKTKKKGKKMEFLQFQIAD